MIIGISGKKQHGKNLVASIIQGLIAEKQSPDTFTRIPKNIEKDILDKHDIYSIFESGAYKNFPTSIGFISNWEQRSFAYKLKEIVSILTGYSLQQLELEEIKSKELGEEYRRWYWSYYKFEMPSNPKGKISNYFSSEQDAVTYSTLIKVMDKSLADYFPKMVLKSEIPTIRELLQVTGTQFGRDLIHPNIWINSLFNEYKKVFVSSKTKELKYPNWIITDVRFPNEAQAIKDREGLIIRINRHYYSESLDFKYHVWDDIKDGSGNRMTFTKENYTKEEAYSRFVKDTYERDHPSETVLDDYQGFDEVIFNDGSITDLINKVKEILIKYKII